MDPHNSEQPQLPLFYGTDLPALQLQPPLQGELYVNQGDGRATGRGDSHQDGSHATRRGDGRQDGERSLTYTTPIGRITADTPSSANDGRGGCGNWRGVVAETEGGVVVGTGGEEAPIGDWGVGQKGQW